MGPFIFVIIAAIAVFPTLIAFKVIIERIKAKDVTRDRGLIQFFISIAVIEIIPILLIFYAYSNLSRVSDFNEIIVPGLLIFVFVAVGAFFIFLQGNLGVPKEEKQQMRIFTLIGIALMNAIPMMCIIGLLMMAF